MTKSTDEGDPQKVSFILAPILKCKQRTFWWEFDFKPWSIMAYFWCILGWFDSGFLCETDSHSLVTVVFIRSEIVWYNLNWINTNSDGTQLIFLQTINFLSEIFVYTSVNKWQLFGQKWQLLGQKWPLFGQKVPIFSEYFKINQIVYHLDHHLWQI